MEGVGARLGRSSNRYGPAPVFTGPVRRWKKKWVHASPSPTNHQAAAAANGNVNGSNGSSHLLFYKWTPITPSRNKDNGKSNSDSNNGNADSKISNKDDDAVAADEPPRRKLKYVPIVLLEDLNNESSQQNEDESKPVETDTNATAMEATSKEDGSDEKPDINDIPMDESQAPENNTFKRHDLNESTLDLSLGLKSHDGENGSDPNANQS